MDHSVKCKMIVLIFLQAHWFVQEPSGTMQMSPALGGSRSVARPGRGTAAPGDDVRVGSAEREDLALPADPHSTFNKEAKKEPLNNVVFQ